MSDILIEAETRLNEMIADIGETTGKQHPTLNDGVQELKKGYGQGGTEEIETIIYESGVLDSTEGTVEEKVEQLIDKAEYETFFSHIRFFKCEGNTNIVKTPLLDCINLKSLESAFSGCINLEEIYVKNTQNVTTWTNTFGAPYINTIETLDFSGANSIPKGLFGGDYIANVKIVPNTIKVNIRFGTRSLASESIDSIINGLTVVETTQTLTLHADVKAKLTEEQIATITNKNWTLA